VIRKVLVAIQSCIAHVDRLRAQLETWATVPTKFDIMAFDGPLLGCRDDYAHLPEKTRAMCKWIYERGYDFALKVDTDTYVHLPRLEASGFERHDYTGYVLDWIKGYAYCSGPHYWLSRRAMHVLATANWSKFPIPGADGWEDCKVGAVLAGHGIRPVHDHRYSPFDPVLPGNDIISQHLSGRQTYVLQAMYDAHREATQGPRVSAVKDKTALLLISTGERYHKFIWPLLESAKHFFPPFTAFLWTDCPRKFTEFQFPLANEGHPATTLHRYRTALRHKKELSKFDYIFHCDIDMMFQAEVAPETIFSNGITATLHGGHFGTIGTPERRECSTASMDSAIRDNQYFAGAFVGGRAESYLKMAEALAKNIAADDSNGVIAEWFDESHLNKYLYEHPPAKILSPSFCFPQRYVDGAHGWSRDQFPPVLACLDK
jgi:hypothetical protein